MHARSLILAVSSSIPLLFAGASASAGLTLVTHSTARGMESVQEIRLDEGRLRMDIDRPATQSLLFVPSRTASSEPMIYELDHGRRTYVKMKESDLKKMGSALQQAQEQAGSLLAALPPEMRKQVEGALGGAASSRPAAAAIVLKPTGRKETVGRYSCEVFAGTAAATGKSKVPLRQEVCVARLESLGVDGLRASDFEALGSVARLASSLSGSFGLPDMPKIDPAHSKDAFGFDGVPVRMRQLEGSKVVAETTVETIRRESVDPALFIAPANYKKTSASELLTR